MERPAIPKIFGFTLQDSETLQLSRNASGKQVKRVLYLACYDISCPKRLRKVHETVQAYAIGGQKSFYECWLTDSERHELLGRIASIFDEQEDKFRLFQLDPRAEAIFMGKAKRQSSEPFLIL